MATREGNSKCLGKLVFQEKNGKLEGYCYEEKDLTDFSSIESYSDIKKKCGNIDNIFYESQESGRIGVYCSLEKSGCQVSDAKLNEKQREAIRKRKEEVSRKITGFGSEVRAVLDSFGRKEIPLENILAELEEAKKKDKVAEEKRERDAVLQDYKAGEYGNGSLPVGKSKNIAPHLANFNPKKLEEAKKKDRERDAVLQDYKAGKYGNGSQVKDVMAKFNAKLIMLENIRAKLEKAQKEEKRERDAVLQDYKAGKYGNGCEVKYLMEKVKKEQIMPENIRAKLEKAQKEYEEKMKQRELNKKKAEEQRQMESNKKEYAKQSKSDEKESDKRNNCTLENNDKCCLKNFGLSKNITLSEVDKVYRECSKKMHPDRRRKCVVDGKCTKEQVESEFIELTKDRDEIKKQFRSQPNS
jgi:hypothetical protein